MFTFVLLLVLLLLHLRLLPGALLQVLVLAGGEGELDGGHSPVTAEEEEYHWTSVSADCVDTGHCADCD